MKNIWHRFTSNSISDIMPEINENYIVILRSNNKYLGAVGNWSLQNGWTISSYSLNESLHEDLKRACKVVYWLDYEIPVNLDAVDYFETVLGQTQVEIESFYEDIDMGLLLKIIDRLDSRKLQIEESSPRDIITGQ